jgi:hypothetical protein
MINLDEWIVLFISQNWIALTLAIGVLRAIAKMTPFAHDDSIVALLSGVFNQVRGKPPIAVPPLSERGQEVK